MTVQIINNYNSKVVYETQVAHRSSACDVIRMWATDRGLRCYEHFLMLALSDYTRVLFGVNRYFGRIIDNSPEYLAEVARRLNDPRCKRKGGKA